MKSIKNSKFLSCPHRPVKLRHRSKILIRVENKLNRGQIVSTMVEKSSF